MNYREENPMVHIYILIDPETNEIRYVGQTTGYLQERLNGHRNPKAGNKTHVANWTRRLKEKGQEPQIVEIDFVGKVDADEAEMLYIKEYRLLGCPLTNLSDGGQANREVSEETRSKLSSALKGRKLSKSHVENMTASLTGRKLSASHRKNIKTSMEGHLVSPDTRRKISDAKKGDFHTEETRKKMSVSKLGKKQSATTKAKRSSALRGKPWSETRRLAERSKVKGDSTPFME